MHTFLVNASEVELLRALLRHHVRFLVIGGHAVIFHGHLRPAKDLDIWVSPEGENPSRLINAFASIGILSLEINQQRLSQKSQQLRLNGQFNTELLTSVAGLDFEGAYSSSVQATVTDIKVPVVSMQNLLVSKRALLRPQDIEDIQALEKLYNL